MKENQAVNARSTEIRCQRNEYGKALTHLEDHGCGASEFRQNDEIKDIKNKLKQISKTNK